MVLLLVLIVLAFILMILALVKTVLAPVLMVLKKVALTVLVLITVPVHAHQYIICMKDQTSEAVCFMGFSSGKVMQC